MNIRSARNNDTTRIAGLFTESVHKTASSSYNREQLDAWAPHPPDLKQWRSRLSECETLVAEVETELAGFISFTSGGHIEFLFTSPSFARQGIASQLYRNALNMLKDKSIDRITTAASLEARPFFERQGFQVTKKETVMLDGVPLKRFIMEIHLAYSARHIHAE
ncbi:MAG: GNAT family N-acetyltransferase [Candidatus Thiodiazotropha sp.]